LGGGEAPKIGEETPTDNSTLGSWGQWYKILFGLLHPWKLGAELFFPPLEAWDGEVSSPLVVGR